MHGVWILNENVVAIKAAARSGYGFVVLDVEHGSLGRRALLNMIDISKSEGLKTIVKCSEPSRVSVQYPLDLGAHGVMIPHLETGEHAKEVCSFAKFPPTGTRSFGGGVTAVGLDIDDCWLAERNESSSCIGLIETAAAAEEYRQILDLAVVDGVFIGTADLSLNINGQLFNGQKQIVEMIHEIAKYARGVGKWCSMTGWNQRDKSIAASAGISAVVTGTEISF